MSVNYVLCVFFCVSRLCGPCLKALMVMSLFLGPVLITCVVSLRTIYTFLFLLCIHGSGKLQTTTPRLLCKLVSS